MSIYLCIGKPRRDWLKKEVDPLQEVCCFASILTISD